MLLTLSGRSFIKIQFSSFSLLLVAYPFHIATQLQYYVKRVKRKVNDVIFPSGCQALAINLGNKNVKIGIFTGGTSLRSKNIVTDISRYPTGKHEINLKNFDIRQQFVHILIVFHCLICSSLLLLTLINTNFAVYEYGLDFRSINQSILFIT